MIKISSSIFSIWSWRLLISEVWYSICSLSSIISLFITDYFFDASSWVTSRSIFILLKVNYSSSICMVRSLMLDSFSLNLVFNLNISSSPFIIYCYLEAYNIASYYWSCWICCDKDCSLFIAFLFVEFTSWLRRSFSLRSCLFCSISLFKEILASFVLDKINEIISILLESPDRLTDDVLPLLSWIMDFLPETFEDWSKL